MNQNAVIVMWRIRGGRGEEGKGPNSEEDEVDLEEDEEFNNQVQHDVQGIPIEERPAKQAKKVWRPQKPKELKW